MKVLSIKQPWASLIASGIKDIENRTWKTNFRGRILIHTSEKKAGSLNLLLTGDQLRHTRECKKMWVGHTSAIIGEVDIIDCVLNHPSVWAEHFADKKLKNGTIVSVPIYNWVLANPVSYDTPILNVKGKLSFWEFTKPQNQC